ncbi:hypothetical protein Aab01nite_43690 [Paractinoplanes abujensis]|uniref:VWFA domain-containing protein n=1 Tax=Paractinoplanes abujensis TaxID=882441 RepID=A0A7W7CNF5_9ACTN|nr:VWA domain-containing protein [Actinoplanes abujensis]MBB4690006.1 hypothetical protein [Actinoplanes abujensis]GID20779.1 hypothetical protein Aab01nite_43690 [Actinoplanes abujensis]
MTQRDADLRKSVFSRTAMGRGPYVARPPYVMPRWLRRVLLGLLALLLVLLALVACHEEQKPETLARSKLTGARLTTGPICLEEAVDVSSSMLAYTAQRERAERELFGFAKRELQPTDSLTTAFFSGSAKVTLPPTSLQSLTAPAPPPGALENGTLLTPAVVELVKSRLVNPQPCASRALVMITDAELGDDLPQLEAAIYAASYTRIYAVSPIGGRGSLNGGLLGAISVYEFHGGGTAGRIASVLDDARPLDVIFGDILADLTGQRLTKTESDS